MSFVDIARRPPAAAELRRFAQRFGALALLDESSRSYRSGGLGYLRMSDDEALARLGADPTLIRLPLARFGSQVTVGVDEDAWRTWDAAIREADARAAQ